MLHLASVLCFLIRDLTFTQAGPSRERWIAYRKRLQEKNNAERERVHTHWKEETIFHRQKKKKDHGASS